MMRITLVVPVVHQNLEGWISGLQELGAEVRVEAVRISAKKSRDMTEALGVTVHKLSESQWSRRLRHRVGGRDKGRRRFFADHETLAQRLADADVVIARSYSVPLLLSIRRAIRGRPTRFLVYEQYDPRAPSEWWRQRRSRRRSAVALYGTVRLRLLGQVLAHGVVSPVVQTPLEQALDDRSVVPFAVTSIQNVTPRESRTDMPSVCTDATRILMVARFERRKRHDLAIEALALLKSEGHLAHLTIVGQAYGPREEAFRQELLSTIESSNLANEVEVETNLDGSSVAERYAKSDVFILPSDREPASISVVEAAARGLPVIVSRTCGTACYVLDGVTGLHIDEGSSSQLAGALRRLIDDPHLRRSMAARAVAHVGPLVDPTTVARRLLAAGT